MAKVQMVKGSTSQLVRIFIQDSTSTTGAGKTGLTAASFTGTKVYVARDDDGNSGGTSVTLTDATRGTWSSGGIKEKDATNMPGVYELGLTNASLATGSRTCDYYFIGSGIAPLVLEIELTNVDNQDANYIRTGTAQSGSNATNIKLDASASSTNDIYKGLLVRITGGTGIGQVRCITNYNGSTKFATTDRNWVTTPDNTSTFALIPANSPILNQNLQIQAGSSQATIRTGTAQTGSTSNTIKLDSGASATSNVYNNNLIQVTGGTGLGQARTIVSYNGTTKVATVDRNWITTPDNTTAFTIVADTTSSIFSNQGVAQAASSSTITLASTASAIDDIYNGSLITILSGTDSGDTGEITDYNGTTKVATVSPNWASTPDTTSAYAVIPLSQSSTSSGSDTPGVTTLLARIASSLDITSGKVSVNFDAAELAKILTTDSTKTWDDVVAGSIAKLIADNVHIYIAGLGL